MEANMAQSTVNLTDSTHRVLQALSAQTGKSIPEILAKAVEEYRRKVFFEGLDRDYAALKADPEAWAEELQERQLFANTLMDAIDPTESWPDDARAEG
jgi:hypothetical protein